jgi:hypothetical protein
MRNRTNNINTDKIMKDKIKNSENEMRKKSLIVMAKKSEEDDKQLKKKEKKKEKEFNQKYFE